MTFADEDWKCLPGGTLIRQGIADLFARKTTIEACLVVIALSRMKDMGLVPGDFRSAIVEGELTLYRLLRSQPGDAYLRYNAFLHELTSFLQTAPGWMRSTGKTVEPPETSFAR